MSQIPDTVYTFIADDGETRMWLDFSFCVHASMKGDSGTFMFSNRIVVYLQKEIAEWCERKSKEKDERTGEPVIIEKMKKKLNECWPHGIENEDFHGPYTEERE